jgi:hypothetical protein
MVMMLARHFLLARLVAVTVLIQITGLMVGMVVVLTGHFFLTCLIAVAMLVDIPRLVTGVIVMLTRLFLCHLTSPCSLEATLMQHAGVT